jgi:DnaJ-class molecular chaperone
MPTTFKDYYATLGVPRTATDKEIRSAFRKLARKHHPDVNPGDKAAEQRFKEINEANEVLSDPEKRRKYDELGPRWQEYEAWERAGKPGPNPFSGSGPRYEYRTVNPEELEELFGDSSPFSDFFTEFFGPGSRGFGGGSSAFQRGRGARRTAVRPGEDIEGEAEISLEEAFHGTTRTVELSGAGGTRRVEVRIPTGIRDGARVRAGGQGGLGQGGAAAGDLYVKVRIRPDSRFTRHGDNLTTRIAVPLATTLAGGSVPVSTLRGSTVHLTIPPGTQNRAKLRLRGLGMPHLNGSGVGDLVAEVDVRLPSPVPDDLLAWAERQRRE